MAPSKTKTAPHKSNDHKRYLAEDVNEAAGFSLDLDGSDVDGKTLQPVKSKDSDFEGFGSEEDGKDSEDGEDSDAGSVKINIDDKKHAKVILPKDAEEEELERLIFGDSAGFKDGLENFSLSRTAGMYGGDASDEDQEEDADLENVADDNLFFFDTGPEAAPAGSVAVTKADESEDEDDKPAWDDSDDERLVVSLASVPQLRKLRETAEDDMVNGKEYARRLRKQYERLYPAPAWAAHATGKKRRRTMDDDESGEESGSDMDVDEDDLSTQPLARLLKDADILSRNVARGPAKRRKLQAGTIDIQRLKDVSKAGPVSFCHATLNIALIKGSLRSLLSHSTLHTHCSSRLDPARRSHSTMSTQTHQTQTLCSHRYTSSVPHSPQPRSTPQRLILVSS